MTRKEAFEKLSLPRWYGISEPALRGWLVDSLVSIGLVEPDVLGTGTMTRETEIKLKEDAPRGTILAKPCP